LTGTIEQIQEADFVRADESSMLRAKIEDTAVQVETDRVNNEKEQRKMSGEIEILSKLNAALTRRLEHKDATDDSVLRAIIERFANRTIEFHLPRTKDLLRSATDFHHEERLYLLGEASKMRVAFADAAKNTPPNKPRYFAMYDSHKPMTRHPRTTQTHRKAH